jgi:hypothetical protein
VHEGQLASQSSSLFHEVDERSTTMAEASEVRAQIGAGLEEKGR